MEIWNDDRIRALRELRAQGHSYGQAALELNARFSTGFTRDAVIGKANRLGMIGRSDPRPVLPARGRSQAAAAPAMAPPGVPAPAAPAAPAPIALRCADITPLLLPLTALSHDQCRYPYGEGPYTFCGHPRRNGSSYCPDHAELVAGPDAIAIAARRALRRDYGPRGYYVPRTTWQMWELA